MNENATSQQFEHRRHESEKRHTFLLRLSDVLRGEADARQVERLALQMLAEHLSADRAYITTSDYAAGVTEVPAEVRRLDLPPLLGLFPHSEYPESSQAVNEGTMVIRDVGNDPNLSDLNRRSFAALRIGSVVGFGLRKGVSHIFWTLAVATEEPRQWTPDDVLLLEHVAERVWSASERARSDTALRDSEQRFRQFADASSGVLWIRDAATMRMEYASPAIDRIYGISPDELLGDLQRWAVHVVPEDREASLANLIAARDGRSTIHEFRILRASDDTFRWIRDTNFLLLDEQGRVQRIGGISEDVTEAKQATEHQNVLLFELQHRVRNILAMTRSVTQRTGDTAQDVAEYRDRLEGRMRALAHVQVLLTRNANAGVDLATLVRDEVEAQAEHASQLHLSGPELVLSPKCAEVLTLAIHELTTNALKYGALTDAAGSLSVTWRIAYEEDQPWLRLDWQETKGTGPVHPPTRRGFGTELIEERIPYELDGRGRLSYRPVGLACHLTFPLRRGDSILETDAVTLATTIEGGSLDMAGEADLTGCRVLVVEDDFYLAADTARALRKAGAEVLGPVGKEDQALRAIADQSVACALVDLNLGAGLQFKVADALGERGIPYVSVTGYDDVMIPNRFRDVPRMRKPTDFRQVVRAAAALAKPQHNS